MQRRTQIATALAVLVLGVLANVVQAHTQDGWMAYRDAKLGFSIAYPKGWKVDTAYAYPGFGPDHDIHGVAFEIPASLQPGTNLSSNNTSISVESVGGTGACTAARFLPDPQGLTTLTDSGIRYSVATGGDAG